MEARSSPSSSLWLLIVIAWKVFAGIVKTIVLLVILGAAAFFVFGGFA